MNVTSVAPRILRFALVLVVGLQSAVFAQRRPVDTNRSTVTVYVFKSGLFSMFADNHVIRAPLGEGAIDESETPSVEIAVDPGRLQVLDPGLSAKDRAEVQQRMLGPEVLDIQQFRDIRFRSTAVHHVDATEWIVEGSLTIHGVTRPVKARVVREGGRYVGSLALKQSDYGIKPISIVGGTVKVKDTIRVEFDIAGSGLEIKPSRPARP